MGTTEKGGQGESQQPRAGTALGMERTPAGRGLCKEQIVSHMCAAGMDGTLDTKISLHSWP